MIRRSSIDGVVTLAAPLDGPVLARLRFRVGTADEPLVKRGITHVVEHLTLSALGSQPYQYNGQVTPTHTTFMAIGAWEQVRAFLLHVCQALGDIPRERFSDELRILQVEASRRESGHVESDLATRFGAVGPGACGWAEYGLRSITADEVQRWADRWFTRDNALLTLSSTPPDDLALPLAAGPAPEHAPTPPNRVSGRRWSAQRTKLVSVSIVRVTMSEKPAGLLGVEAARERAFQRLRSQSAISYSVNALQLGIGQRRTLCQLAADAERGSYGEVLEQLGTALRQVCEEGPSAAELELITSRVRLAMQDRNASLGLLEFNAGRLERGEELCDAEEFNQGFRDVTAGDVVRTLSPSLDSVLAIGPQELGAAPPGWQEMSFWSTQSVQGEEFPATPGQERGRLVVGTDGIMWRLNDQAYRAVRWNDCAAALCWDNGSRRIIGSDGLAVFAAPWAFSSRDRLPALIDQHLTPDVQVWLDPATAPQPRRVETPAQPRPGRRTLRRNQQLVGLLIAASLLALLVVIAYTSGPTGNGVGIAVLAVAVVGLNVARFMWRRPRR